MIGTEHIEQHHHRAASLPPRWPLLCLLAAIALFLSLGQSTPLHANDPEPQYVTSAADADFDCDGAHALLGSHCCTGVACSAYAQLEAALATSSGMIGGHPLLIAEGIRVGQAPLPNLQPPQDSIQA
jgi:hypothetical protein